jgi:hypothetical protein
MARQATIGKEVQSRTKGYVRDREQLDKKIEGHCAVGGQRVSKVRVVEPRPSLAIYKGMAPNDERLVNDK